jgi:hypothetical protein
MQIAETGFCPRRNSAAVLFAGLLAGSMALGAGTSQAQVLLGSSSTKAPNPASLFMIDASTGLATLVGPSGLSDAVSAIRFDPLTKTLYGILGSPCTGAQLITVDPATGTGTIVGTLVGAGFDGGTGIPCGGGSEALEFALDGTLYAGGFSASGGSVILKVDKTTAAVLESHVTTDVSTGLAFDPSGRLWVSHGNSTGVPEVHTLDPATGAYTSTLTLSEFVVISDLAFSADGTLYASLPSENQLATIDTATGIVTRIGSFGAAVSRISGLAFAPPPPTPTPTPTPTSTPTPTQTPTPTSTPTPTPTPPPSPTPTPTSPPASTPTPTQPPPRGLASLGPAHLWIGLKNSDDSGSAFDVRVELIRNGNPVSSGLVRCVSGLGRQPSAVDIPFGAFAPVQANSGDVFSLRVSNRRGTSPDDTLCGNPGTTHTSAVGMRLHYDSPALDSRLGASINGNTTGRLFLHSDGSACSSRGSSGVTSRILDGKAPEAAYGKCQDSPSGNPGGDNSWKEIGVWSLTVP